nr:hypothetical protein [Neorhizobium galegae]
MDQTLGNACYVTTAYEGGTILRLGFDFTGATGRFYLALGNTNWQSLEAGKDYPIEIKFDDQPVWTATARGADFANSKWLHVTTENSNFADEFSRKLGMRVTFQGRQIAALRLKGSARAIDEMLACQKTVNSVVGAQRPQPPSPPKDPFAPAPGAKNANDPFDL